VAVCQCEGRLYCYGAKVERREKPVECMGINLGTAAQCHFKTNQVAFAKAEIETGFYSEGTGKTVNELS
jgi:hypothetical protein